jgi:uncharacterized protein YlbG (UPF0298 family)
MKFKLNKKGQIEKSDFVVIYNKEDFQNALDQGLKKIEELELTKKVHDAKCDNISRNHQHVLKLDEQARNEVWLYQDNYISSKQIENSIKSYKKAMKALKDEVKQVEKETGLKFK